MFQIHRSTLILYQHCSSSEWPPSTCDVGGSTIQKISRFGKAALHAATLGFFIGLAGIAAMDDPPVEAHQVAIFVIVFGYVIYCVCSAIVERYENEGND